MALFILSVEEKSAYVEQRKLQKADVMVIEHLKFNSK